MSKLNVSGQAVVENYSVQNQDGKKIISTSLKLESLTTSDTESDTNNPFRFHVRVEKPSSSTKSDENYLIDHLVYTGVFVKA
jgi:hypothetical protein